MKRITSSYSQLNPLWIAVFVDILGFTIILPFLPLLAKQYSTDALTIGLLIASNAIFGSIFSPILGKLSDKYGRKPLLLISQAGTFIGFLILAFSNSLQMLFLARIIDGFFGGQFPISQAVIGDVVPPKERGRQMTNIGTAFTLAAVIGPGVGGLLSQYFGIIGPGLLASGVATFAFIFTAIRLPETLPTKISNPPEWLNQMREFAQKQGNILPTSIWKNNKAVYILAMYSFISIAAMMFQSTYSLFGSIRLNFTVAQIGLLFSIMGIFQIFFRFVLFNPIRDKLGDTKTALIGLFNYILAYLLLGIVVGFVDMMLVLFYISIAGAMSRGIVTAFASRVVDFRSQGKMMGLTTSIDNLSQIFGPIIGSFILLGGNGLIFSGFLSILSIIAFVMSLRLIKFGFENFAQKGPQIPIKENIPPSSIPVTIPEKIKSESIN
jgi:DHA1 family tetracycline resistance protein-like MFS transporter